MMSEDTEPIVTEAVREVVYAPQSRFDNRREHK